MNSRMWTGLVLGVLVSGSAALAQPPSGFTNHGVPVPVSRGHGAIAVTSGSGDRVVLAWISSENVTTKLAVNVETGAHRQMAVEPGRSGVPGVSLYSSRDLWYTTINGHFYEFDPETIDFSFIEEIPGSHVQAITEDDAGTIWGFVFPSAHLIRFDPEARELSVHGPVNEEPWRQYSGNIVHGDDGWIYGGIGNTAAQVFGYHPPTGEIRTYIPEEERAHGGPRVWRAPDGTVYVTGPGWEWHTLSDGEPTASDPAGPSGLPRYRRDYSDPQRIGRGGVIWDEFSDGSRIKNLQIDTRTLVVEEADGRERTIEFDYESEGSTLRTIVLGPDGALHGASIRHVYQFDPDTASTDFRRQWDGRWNALVASDGYLYGGTYTGGKLDRYDVNQPWNPGTASDSNPRRVIGSSRPHINGPRVLLAHPDGRHLIMGGRPGYGRAGGGLHIYDGETEQGDLLTHEQVVEHQFTLSLTTLPDGTLVGGTTIATGQGGEVQADEAVLYLFDLERREVLWQAAVVPGADAIRDLVTGPDSRVYGMGNDSTFFVFDPEARRVVYHEPLADAYGEPAGSVSPRMMSIGPDGMLYALFRDAIVQIEPGSFKHHKLAASPVTIGAGIVIHAGELYFTSGSRLWSYRLPSDG